MFFPEGMVTNPAILFAPNVVRIFLSLPTGRLHPFVVIFHEYISFRRLGSIFKKIILKQKKPIDNLLIFSFSLS